LRRDQTRGGNGVPSGARQGACNHSSSWHVA